MKVITHFKKNALPHFNKKICLAIGNFDGLHLGHQKLLGRIFQEAARIGGTAAVFTFARHPHAVLKPNEPFRLITPWKERFELLRHAGVSVVYLLRFTKKFSLYSPEIFVREILVKKIGVHSVLMGHNARFGHHRGGTQYIMKRLAKKYGFRFRAVKAEKRAGAVVNSTRIRSLILRGHLRRAAKMLGRSPTILGKVIHGSSRGKVLGFPTANMFPENDLLPPCGVYVVSADIVDYSYQKKTYGFDFHKKIVRRGLSGLLNVGFRPTFPARKFSKAFDRSIRPLPEVFLLNFRGNLYGKYLKLHLLKYLRPERKFRRPVLLVRQIKKDIQTARKYMRKQRFTI
ncbi:MAG: riboflavin biosynthesis protein RibF [Candidatus Omnitrophica bacterium]|nr:riboflavin biosynthesis protein RibF [Candidatus Omnitrophota bacterium]